MKENWVAVVSAIVVFGIIFLSTYWIVSELQETTAAFSSKVRWMEENCRRDGVSVVHEEVVYACSDGQRGIFRDIKVPKP